MSISAKFIGLQETLDGNAIRLYNITGNHFRSGSTVTVNTLLELGIQVPDLDEKALLVELDALKCILEGRGV